MEYLEIKIWICLKYAAFFEHVPQTRTQKKKQDMAVCRHLTDEIKIQDNRDQLPTDESVWFLRRNVKTRSAAQRKVEIGRRQNSESLLHGKCKIRNYLWFAQRLGLACVQTLQKWIYACCLSARLQHIYIFAVIMPAKSWIHADAAKRSCGEVVVDCRDVVDKRAYRIICCCFFFFSAPPLNLNSFTSPTTISLFISACLMH